MALFEFEDGRLIPAQFGRAVAAGLSVELVDAICSQVLEIVSRPLFPITWRDLSSAQRDAGDSPRLTCLDASGQVVSVEVVAHLDSDTLIASLSRLADAAALSWSDLAHEYEGGIDAFKAGWLSFRDSMPPAPGAGPRLVMVVGSIDPQVRPALDVLATSGVEVHEVSMRRMSNGRTFIEVVPVGPRLYGHAPQIVSQSTSVSQIGAAPERGTQEEGQAHPNHESASHAHSKLHGIHSAEMAYGDAREPESRIEAENHARQDDEFEGLDADRMDTEGPTLLSHDAHSLRALAHIIGEDVPLVAHPDCRAPFGLVLGRDGIIRSDAGQWESPSALEEFAPGLASAWDHLRIATLSGPSLSESIDEVNAEIRREYAQSGPGHSNLSVGRHARD